MILFFGTTLPNFNCYTLLCGNNAPEQKLFTHPWPAMYMHLYNAAKQTFTYIIIIIIKK
jgi:hypothetical protein